MPTLYQRLEVFYAKDKFRFKERDKKRIGIRISTLWKELHSDEIPPVIQSIEDTGTYQVFEYFEEFTPLMDQMIRNVHKEILDASKERKRLAANPPENMAISSPAPPLALLPKKRKRKQIPAWKSR